MDLGNRIQNLLDEKDVTQRQLAADLHLNPNTVNGYIKNRRFPDCETIARIAAYLDTTVDYLLGNTNFRHCPHFPVSDREGLLLGNYRALNEHGKQTLEEISSSLYRHLM